MDILTSLFFLLLGAAVGSWFGHKSGYKDGLSKGKADGVKEGMKEYLRKELIESKILGGTYNADALGKAREELQKALIPQASKKKEKSSWLAFFIVAVVLVWAVGTVLKG
ncbi:MAG: hypothetical protein QJT81_05575 [Candidatus Thiothrix putei]|uniref:Uncharacterized protein n=1 Tax=Candidatus Thiothrix putei TaxID=3080811 RepID=A0AA95HJG4_9GAMM|nr:MAG: hypothetical protein QJT81_05575 [Candidatus Thiothrix putei]